MNTTSGPNGIPHTNYFRSHSAAQVLLLNVLLRLSTENNLLKYDLHCARLNVGRELVFFFEISFHVTPKVDIN